jgi:hypothetical protein
MEDTQNKATKPAREVPTITFRADQPNGIQGMIVLLRALPETPENLSLIRDIELYEESVRVAAMEAASSAS